MEINEATSDDDVDSQNDTEPRQPFIATQFMTQTDLAVTITNAFLSETLVLQRSCGESSKQTERQHKNEGEIIKVPNKSEVVRQPVGQPFEKL